jgi:hypothetical protein
MLFALAACVVQPCGTAGTNQRIKRRPPMAGGAIEALVASQPVSAGTGMCGWAGLYEWLYRFV